MKIYKTSLPEITLRMKPGTMLKAQIKSSTDATNIFKQIFDESINIYESMFAVYLNRANNTIGWMRISQGGLSGTVVDTRLILKAGIESLCSSIILCHNHPSGNKNPSDADTKITQKLKIAAQTLEIKLLDHIILTEDSFFSFADEGLI